jgi:hypothetical protein
VFSHPPGGSDHLRALREKLRQDTRDSFQLLANFWDNPICSIIHDEAHHCIIVVWKQYATQIQLRDIHENLLTLICKHRVDKILGDDTALPAIPSEDRFWIIEEWFPRAVECGLRFAASKRPASHFGKLPSARFSRRLPPASSAGPSSSCTKPGNGSRQWRPGRLTRPG